MSSFSELKQNRQARRPAISVLTQPPRSTRAQVQASNPPRPDTTSTHSKPPSSLSQATPTAEQQKCHANFVSSPSVASFFKLAENGNLEVCTSETGGRGIYWSPRESSSTCKRGQVLLSLTPSVKVPDSSHLSTTCSSCFTDQAKPLQRCSGCKVIKYCSLECQKGDWPSHKQECKALRATKQLESKAKQSQPIETDDHEEKMESPEASHINSPTVPATTVRAMARLIWAMKQDTKGLHQAVMGLQSNRTLFSPLKLEKLGQMCIQLAFFLGADKMMATGQTNAQSEILQELGFPNAKDLLDVACKFALNSFSLTGPDLSGLGICLHPTVALFSHSCWPNAAIVFPYAGRGKNNNGQQTMHLVAIRDIKPGQEVTVSYIDVADRFVNRQQKLKEGYGFECDCVLCQHSKPALNQSLNSQWRDPREALWCPKKCGGWVSRPTNVSSPTVSVCNKCKKQTNLNPAFIQNDIEEGTAAFHEGESHFDKGNPELAWKSFSKVIPSLLEKYPPSSQPLFDLLRSAQNALIQLGSMSMPPEEGLLNASRQVMAIDSADSDAMAYYFQEATRVGLLLVAGAQASMVGANMEPGPIYCEGHPARTIALATLAKVSLFDPQNATQAFESGQLVRTASEIPSILPNPPFIPPAMRLQFAQQILCQALCELEIGFGQSNRGGMTGQEIRKLLKEVEEEAAILARAATMS